MVQKCRRDVLLASGTAAVAAIAGCSSFNNSNDNSSEESGNVEWLSWIPQSEYNDEIDVIHLDVPEAVDTFPETALSDIGIEDLSNTYNVEPDEVENFIVVTDGAETDTTAVVLEAPLNPDELIDEFSINEDERESYNGYDVVQQDVGSNLALSESSLIVASSPRIYIDAKAGEAESLEDNNGDLKTTASRVNSATLSGILSGDESVEDVELSADPLWGGAGISAGEGDTARLEVHVLFESASDAEAVLENDEDELTGSLEESETDTLTTLSQDGRYIVAEIESESYQFD